MKSFTWDCPKCGYRTTVDLPVSADVELKCARCAWTIGEERDASLQSPEEEPHPTTT